MSEITLIEPRATRADDHQPGTVAFRGRRLLRTLRRQPGLAVAAVFVLVVVSWAVVPGLWTHRDPLVGDIAERLQGPSAAHPFGTDNLGRDLWSRIVHGTAESLAASVLAVLLALVVGSVVGLLAGFVRGIVDDIVMRIVDVFLAVPAVLLSLAIITALGFGTVNVAVAVGFASAASFARIMRSDAISVSTAVYVEAARAAGVRWHTILRRHVLPHALGPVLALSALEFGGAVLAIASLSFLGFGAPPPAPEWGALIAEGRDYLATSWWLTTIPGVVIVALVLAANRIGQAFERRGGHR